MNLEKLKEGISLHKKNSPKTYNENINMTIPLFVLHQKIYNTTSKMLEVKYKISSTELDVLASLVIGGGDDYILSPTELYGRLLFSSGGMTKILKKLETKEYIIRLENKDDKRSKLVKLTSKGRNMLDIALKDSVKSDCSFFEPLNKDEKDNFKNLLFKILENCD